MGLKAVVVVPARDEEATIVACLRALAAQTVGRDAFRDDHRPRRLPRRDSGSRRGGSR